MEFSILTAALCYGLMLLALVSGAWPAAIMLGVVGTINAYVVAQDL